ncbi:MAG: hypothetical protein U0414_02335 [Polyangiaceae bacterium]
MLNRFIRVLTVQNTKRLAPYLAVLGLFFVVRLAHANADPPLGLPNGLGAHELMVEPIAKAHEARNWALTGHWKTSDVDNYEFWRAQSWAWVYPLALWMRLFGVSYVSLHAFTTTVAALGFVAVLLLATRRRGVRGAVVVGVMLALNYYDVVYHRVGLIETAVNTWIAWTVVFLDRARDNGYALSAALVTFFLGFFSKLNILVFGPMALGFGLVFFVRSIRRKPADGEPPRTIARRLVRWTPVLQALVMLGLVAWYCTREAYTRSLIRNTGHVVLGKLAKTSEELDTSNLGDAFARYVNPDTWTSSLLAVVPVALPLAVIQILRVPLAWIRRRDLDHGFTLLVGAWLVSATFTFAAAPNDIRFRLGTIAPACLLAGSLLVDAYLAARDYVARTRPHAWTRWAWASGALVASIVCASFLLWVPAYKTAWLDRKYDLLIANRRIREIVGDRADATVVGSWAGPIVFETPYRYYYVRAEFNSTRAALASLGITHVLLAPTGNDFTGNALRRNFSNLMKLIKQRGTLDVRGRAVLVYEVVGEMTVRP